MAETARRCAAVEGSVVHRLAALLKKCRHKARLPIAGAPAEPPPFFIDTLGGKLDRYVCGAGGQAAARLRLTKHFSPRSQVHSVIRRTMSGMEPGSSALHGIQPPRICRSKKPK